MAGAGWSMERLSTTITFERSRSDAPTILAGPCRDPLELLLPPGAAFGIEGADCAQVDGAAGVAGRFGLDVG